MTAPNRRAAPLPADQRRAAILAATVPLLRVRGLQVTTREIAQAAGVAEGTLFRVFPDKETLVEAAVCSAFSIEPLLAEVAKIDSSLILYERMLEIVIVLQRRLAEIIELMTAVRMRQPPESLRSARGTMQANRPSHAAFLEAVADLLEPDRAALTRSPHEVARLLRLVTFAGTHIGITDGEPLTPPEIVSLILDGVRHRTPPDPDSVPPVQEFAPPLAVAGSGPA